MAWIWNPWGAWLAFAGLVFWVMALTVLLARPDRAQNRYLALILGVEPFLVTWGSGLAQLQDSAQVTYALGLVSDVVIPVWGVAYLGFLGTVGLPGLGWTRGRSGAIMLGLLAIILSAWYVSNGGTVAHVGAGAGSVLTWAFSTSAAGRMQWLLFIVFFTFALVGTFTAWHQSPSGSPARRERAFVLSAFAVRDIGLAVLLVLFLADALPLTARLVLTPLPSLLSVGLLGYGILHSQLFDIDLKIKWTIARGTLVGVFLAVFFVVGVIAENWLTDRFGLAFGGVAAGLLLFVLNPLQRLADTVAERAMPNVRDDDEYRTVRKRDVYLAALEGALVDDVVSDRERDMLVRLQDQLGLSATEARTLELRLTAPKEVA